MSKAARQRTARERLAEERRRQASKERKLRTLMTSLAALVVIAVIVVGVVVYQSNKEDTAGYTGPPAPVGRQADGSVLMAEPGVQGPVLEIYEDFQCPACKKMEDTNADTIKRLAAERKAKVIYKPFSLFRDQGEPVAGNSLRALNAAFCAPANKWMAYHDKLYEEQGPESSKGFENKQLIDWGKDVGIAGGGFDQCVNGNAKKADIDRADAAAQRAGAQGTPYVLLNGRPLGDEVFSTSALEKAITSAPAQPATPTTTPPATQSPKSSNKS